MNISYNKEGGVIEFDYTDWNGIMPGGDVSVPANLKQITPGALYQKSIDPFRNYGLLQPGFAETSITNNNLISGAIIAAVLDAGNTYQYGIDTGGKFHQINQTTNPPTITNAGNFPHTVTGTSPVGQDVLIYKHNIGGSPVFSAFYSYYNNANWNVGRFDLSTTFADTFMSATPASPLVISSGDGDDATQINQPHSMCIGADDVLYIASGRYVHAYDGSDGTSNGTFHNKVLSLPFGFVITGMIKFNDSLLIAGNYNTATTPSTNFVGEALVYIWDYNQLDPTQVVALGDPYVSSIFMWRGLPCVITMGAIESRGFIRLKQIVSNYASEITDLPGSTAPVLRGIDGRNNLLYINMNGTILTVGDKIQTGGKKVNNICRGGAGYIRNVPLFGLFTSGSQYKSGYASSIFQSGFITPQFPIGYQGKIKSVQVYFGNAVTSDATKTFSMILYTDWGTVSATLNSLITLAVPLIKRYFLDSSSNPFPTFQNISLYSVWANAITLSDHFTISRVLIEYENTKIDPNS